MRSGRWVNAARAVGAIRVFEVLSIFKTLHEGALHLPGGSGSVSCRSLLTAWLFVLTVLSGARSAATVDDAPDSLALSIAGFQDVIRAHPDLVDPRLALAEAYRLRGNLTACRSTAEEAMSLRLSASDSSRALLLLGRVALAQGRRNDARRKMELAARSEDLPADCLLFLAKMDWEDHQPARALAAGMEAISRDPRDPEAVRWIAERWKEMGRVDQALALRLYIQREGMENDEDLFQIGFLSQRLGDGQRAADSYLKLLSRNPMHPEGHYNFSLLLLAAGDTIEAARHLEKVIESKPDLQQAYLDLAVLYMKRHRTPDARRVLEGFLSRAEADSAVDAEIEQILESIGN